MQEHLLRLVQPNLGVSMCRESPTANIVHKQTMVMNKELTHHQPLLSLLYNICPNRVHTPLQLIKRTTK